MRTVSKRLSSCRASSSPNVPNRILGKDLECGNRASWMRPSSSSLSYTLNVELADRFHKTSKSRGEGPATLLVLMERSIVVFVQSIWIPFAATGKALLFWLYWAKEDGPQSWRQLLPSFDCYSSFSHRIINITAFSLGSSIDRLSVPLLLMLGAPMQPKLGLILMVASLVWDKSEPYCRGNSFHHSLQLMHHPLRQSIHGPCWSSRPRQGTPNIFLALLNRIGVADRLLIDEIRLM